MLKPALDPAELIGEVEDRLREYLAGIPAVVVDKIEREPVYETGRPDLLVRMSAFHKPQILIVETKTVAQPRFARTAILQLRDYGRMFKDAALILAAPYLSPETREICKAENIGYFDLEGNVRINLDNLFIERIVPTRPAADTRHLKSLFKPKSARILRTLLRQPAKSWKVIDLAKDAEVSIGLVSNVRTALLEREWAIETAEGIVLLHPGMLLDAWRDAYEPPPGQRVNFYTIKSPKELETAHLNPPHKDPPHITRAAFSAAAWLAAYGRVSTQYFYVDLTGYKFLKDQLDLSQVERGENVVVTVLGDIGPLRDSVEAAPGIICTSPVQTYLDLWALGERGREAADHLRDTKLPWLT